MPSEKRMVNANYIFHYVPVTDQNGHTSFHKMPIIVDVVPILSRKEHTLKSVKQVSQSPRSKHLLHNYDEEINIDIQLHWVSTTFIVEMFRYEQNLGLDTRC